MLGFVDHPPTWLTAYYDSVFSCSFVLHIDATWIPLNFLRQALPCNSYDNGSAFFHLVLFVFFASLKRIVHNYGERRIFSFSVARCSASLPCRNSFFFSSQNPEQTDLLCRTSRCRLPKIYCIAELCKMSSKYSVTKGNECVNYAEIYSFLMREEPRRDMLSFPSAFFFLGFCFSGPLWRYTWKIVVPKLRSTAQLLLQPFVAVCSLYYNTAKQKKKSSMPNAVLQECVPSTLTDKRNDRGRAIERWCFLPFFRKCIDTMPNRRVTVRW